MKSSLPEKLIFGYTVIDSLVGRLRKKFSPTSEKDVDDAICLANYLFCIDRVAQAGDLLESFVFDVADIEDNEGRKYLWPNVMYGFVLLAQIYRITAPDKVSDILSRLYVKEGDGDSEYTIYELFLMDREY